MELTIRKNEQEQPIAFAAVFSATEVSDKEVAKFFDDCWEKNGFYEKISGEYDISTVCVGGVIAVDRDESTPTKYIQQLIDDIEDFAKQKNLAIITQSCTEEKSDG